MSSIISSQHCNLSVGAHHQDHLCRGRYYNCNNNKLPCFRCSYAQFSCRLLSVRKSRPPVFSTPVDNNVNDESEDENEDTSKDDVGGVDSEILRRNLERIVGTDDSAFSGIDLATLIRNKYGRSYDVQLIKKRSFPLTEEEYILRLDDVANTLKCWGAVSHIRNSLAKSKERPRIGKAVSIFIDMDESGGRANEWIYK
ncbi:uncharacterized protein LOC8284872 isoform X2 [Ricinus communis]|uniref:uncharacterized protein LOC8284872 isoform X2 n=1 Tax=Ricinus communis TaxID=3988 RepID=UPI00201A9FA3|nr:uncharacterized protein LOC8284872 isoform X2 [Ricinus communis]